MSTTDQQITDSPFLTQMNQLLYSSGGNGLTQQNRSDWADQMSRLQTQFAAQFQNLVGRAPTQAEQDVFTNQYVTPNAGGLRTPGSDQNVNASSKINDFVNNYYQQAAKDQATKQLTDQQGQANSLADLFRSQGNTAINSTEQSLVDYQSKLFDKLRPNLLTSLQAQGLLDTGGLNSALAGAQADLANSAQPFLANARLQNDQQANAIAFGGASAPYQYQQGQIMNSVPYLQAQGQAAQQQGYNTFLTNLNYANQLGLQNNAARLQSDMQPGLIGRLGQSFVGSMGTSVGNSMGSYTENPMNQSGHSFMSGMGGGGGGAGMTSLMG